MVKRYYVVGKTIRSVAYGYCGYWGEGEGIILHMTDSTMYLIWSSSNNSCSVISAEEIKEYPEGWIPVIRDKKEETL